MRIANFPFPPTLLLAVLTLPLGTFAQGLNPATPTQEYIHFNGQIVAIESVGQVTVSPSAILFGTVTDGSSSSQQTVTLSNNSSGPLTLSSVTITGANASDFAQNSGCNSPLGAGASCTVSLTATPSQLGGESATLSIADSAPNSPQTVSLYVTGASAASVTAGYGYGKSITINHAQVPNTDQQDFPLSFAGSYGFLATTGNGGNVQSANGYDIIFTADQAGKIPLAFEREMYTSSGAVAFWVQVPTLSHTTDTVIYIWYGNASVTTDQAKPAAVWDTDFKAVYHLAQAPGGSNAILDSTSNQNDATASSAHFSLTAALIGNGLASDGASNSNSIAGPTAVSGGGPMTASMWIKTTGLNSSNQSYLLNKVSWPNSGWEMLDDGQYIYGILWRADPDVDNSLIYVPRGTINDGNWHLLSGTIDANDSLSFYVDGVLQQTTRRVEVDTNTSAPLTFGALSGPGTIDEVRISDINRSADWIATEYGNQSNPGAFYTVE